VQQHLKGRLPFCTSPYYADYPDQIGRLSHHSLQYLTRISTKSMVTHPTQHLSETVAAGERRLPAQKRKPA
jgi:hypothetical protein